jgi:hypothetical protein
MSEPKAHFQPGDYLTSGGRDLSEQIVFARIETKKISQKMVRFWR